MEVGLDLLHIATPFTMEIPEDCLHCGVCCFSKSGTYVRVSESDLRRLGAEAHVWAREVGGKAYMRMEEGHCLALHITNPKGQLPVYHCQIYERRPQVCRELARGKAACRTELLAKEAAVRKKYGSLTKP